MRTLPYRYGNPVLLNVLDRLSRFPEAGEIVGSNLMNLGTCGEEQTHGDKVILMRISLDSEEKKLTDAVSGSGSMTGKMRTNFCE